MERPKGIGEVERQLKKLSEGELLGVLNVAGEQIEELGVKTSVPQIIMDGFRESGHKAYEAQHINETMIPSDFIAVLLRREPELRRDLSTESFEKLIDSVSMLAMSSQVLHEKYNGIDYQAAGFEPKFSERLIA